MADKALLAIALAAGAAAALNRYLQAQGAGGAVLVFEPEGGGNRTWRPEDALADQTPGAGIFGLLADFLEPQTTQRVATVGNSVLASLDEFGWNPLGPQWSPFPSNPVAGGPLAPPVANPPTAPLPPVGGFQSPGRISIAPPPTGGLFGLGDPSKPRGIRNGNPGNIEAGIPWEGVTGSDGRFATFDDPRYGIRALAMNLGTYRDRYGLRTVGDMISRWSPPSYNNTAAYIRAVENGTSLSRNTVVNSGNVDVLVGAIIKHENGFNPYPQSVIREGIGLSGKWR